MIRQVSKQYDVLVIGGGPAGMAAAASAAGCGAHVGIVDDNPSFGGQIWRGEAASPTSQAASWIEKLRAARDDLLCGMRVIDHPATNVFRAETLDGSFDLRYRKLVLATGARERFLPFPGWTLPNVMGAGALQALVKSGLPISGKRVVVAGTGPLLLAVATYLRKHGAEIALVAEQASLLAVARFALSLLSLPRKASEAWSLRKELSGGPWVTSCWPVAAEGDEILRAVSVRRGRGIDKIPCDYLACGFHLVPNTELAALLGCEIRNGYVQVDDFQQSVIPGVFCAGEPTGIGGVELALVEGQIAGLAVAGQGDRARHLFSARARLRRFARSVDRAFALRHELKRLPVSETIVCRCEDVTYGFLKHYSSWRAAKLQTRCGMGPCQGRVCGPVTQFLLNWSPDSVRPPIFATDLENLAAMAETMPEQSEATRGPK